MATRHAAVTPLHLLRALANDGTVWRAHLPPCCREQLERILTERLNQLPGASSYRDLAAIAEAPLDAELVALLRPPPKRFFFSKPPPFGRAELLARLFDEASVRAVFAEASADVPSVEEAASDAGRVAVMRHHQRVELTHLVHASIERRWFVDMITACGYDMRRLAFIVDGRLEAIPQGQHAPWYDPLIEQALVTARSRPGSAAVDGIFIAALRAGMLNGLMKDAGLSVEALQLYLVHGCAPPDPLHEPREGLVRVVIHDDDYSVPDTVRSILEELYGLTPEAVRVKMREVREVGSAVIGHWDALDARARTRDARARAAETRSPLLITLRPAS